jgi:membrane protein
MAKTIATQLRAAAGFAVYVGRRYQKDHASNVAASLSYTSLLSLVPLMAIALGMLAAFPVFGDTRNEIEDWAFRNFVPSVGQAVEQQVASFIANAGKLSAAGIIGLGVSAILLLVTIETAFNGVFRVARPRSALSRVLVYWTVMTLGPLLLGASLSLQGYLTALGSWQVASSTLAVLAAPLPTLLSMAAFTVLFATIPNRQVRPRDAVAGGVAAGLLFAVLRFGFAVYITRTDAYSTVYGAVAVVPIVLFWGFLSWVVVLIGAEITAALPEWRAGHGNGDGPPSAGRRLTLALDILAVLQNAARSSDGPVTRSTLLAATAAPEADFARVLRQLRAESLVAVTTGQRYLPARDLGTVTFAELVDSLDLTPALDPAFAKSAPWRPRVEALLGAAHAQTEDALMVPLSEVREFVRFRSSPRTHNGSHSRRSNEKSRIPTICAPSAWGWAGFSSRLCASGRMSDGTRNTGVRWRSSQALPNPLRSSGRVVTSSTAKPPRSISTRTESSGTKSGGTSR